MNDMVIKYQLAELPDFRFRWSNDPANKSIEIEADRLDSSALIQFCTFVLPNKYGIGVVGRAGAVFLTLNGQRFEVQVHPLLEPGMDGHTLIVRAVPPLVQSKS